MSTQASLSRLLPLLLGSAVALTACAGSSTAPAPAAGGTAANTTVEVRATDAGTVLTDSAGRTLYTSEQENGAVRCTSSACTAVWDPLTLTGGMQPTGPQQVAADLGTVSRPDGHTQVTFEGRPLYAFTFDRSAGQAHGNGVVDSFDGTSFTWHVAAAKGTAPSRSAPSSTGGYSY